jgi:hypothetical protein
LGASSKNTYFAIREGRGASPSCYFMGAAVGAIFGKNLSKKGRKVPKFIMAEIGKS